MTETTFTNEEWEEVTDGLSSFHNIFYRFWTVSTPIFSDSVSTAAVSFDKVGNCIAFTINRQFWLGMTVPQRLFVICHECLHVIFNHGKRSYRIYKKNPREMKKLNIAMDVCNNEALIERYGFMRDEIDPDNRYIWADKIAEKLGLEEVPTNKSFEYYYNLIKELDDDSLSELGDTVDEHAPPSQSCDSEDGMIERLKEEMDAGEKQELENKIREEEMRTAPWRDESSVGKEKDLGKVEEVKKRKWETVIKKWASEKLREVEVTRDQWARTARRFTLMDKSLSLPYEAEVTELQLDDFINVWFFLDTSGSCIHLAKRFFKAALSLPKDKFKVHLFCFDEKVYPVDIKSRKVKGGNGTSFEIIESYIRAETKNTQYPHAVFVITDGGGDAVSPKHPERWNWFMSYDFRHFIPDRCHVHMLKDFE